MEQDTDILILSEARVTHTRRWATALQQRGLRVAVLSFTPAQPLEGIPTLQFQIPPFGLKNLAGWAGRYRKALRGVLQKLRPKIVHIHFLEDWRLDRDLLGKTPLVISAWGFDVVISPSDETPDKRQRKIELLRLADRVSATTKFLADATAEYGGIARDSIRVIPFGVEVEHFTPAPPDVVRPPTVGFLKHLEPKYGPDVMLKAFGILKKRIPAARLILIGKGSMQAQLQTQAAELGIADAVEFRGAIPYAQVPAAMAEMDVYAMPSVHASETFGVSAVEAQAAGVPVVASHLPGVAEAVQDGVTAFLTPPGDADALAEALRRVLEDASLRRQMGQAGRAFVTEHFRWAHCVQQMMDLYGSVLEKHD